MWSQQSRVAHVMTDNKQRMRTRVSYYVRVNLLSALFLYHHQVCQRSPLTFNRHFSPHALTCCPTCQSFLKPLSIKCSPLTFLASTNLMKLNTHYNYKIKGFLYVFPCPQWSTMELKKKNQELKQGRSLGQDRVFRKFVF